MFFELFYAEICFMRNIYIDQLLGVGQKGSVSIHDHKGTIVEKIPLQIEKGSVRNWV